MSDKTCTTEDSEPIAGDGLVPRDVIAQVCGDRDKALEAFARFFEARRESVKLLDEAMLHYTRATGKMGETASWALFPSATGSAAEAFFATIKTPKLDGLEVTAQRIVDTAVWRHLVEHSGFKYLMDSRAAKEFEEQLKYFPPNAAGSNDYGCLITQKEADSKALPPVEIDHVIATFEGFREQAPQIFERGVADTFSALDKRFKTHTGFKIGYKGGKAAKTAGRIILDWAMSTSYGWRDSWSATSARQRLLDVERCLRVLDGKSVTKEWDSVVDQVERERKAMKVHGFRDKTTFASEHTNEYFRIRIFENRNAHIWFLRPDLIERVNQILAEYYGAALGWGEMKEKDEEAPLDGAQHRSLAPRLGEFFTPPEVVRRVDNFTRFERLGRGALCLEPSAGCGNLASMLAEAGLCVDCVEIQDRWCKELRWSNPLYREVIRADFLKLSQRPIYRGILMNPPFNLEGGIDHVNHALGFLDVSEGPIEFAAIMGAHAAYGSTPKAEAFRKKLGRLKKEWKASVEWHDMPERSFAESGTNVNTVLLIIRRWR